MVGDALALIGIAVASAFLFAQGAFGAVPLVFFVSQWLVAEGVTLAAVATGYMTSRRSGLYAPPRALRFARVRGISYRA